MDEKTERKSRPLELCKDPMVLIIAARRTENKSRGTFPWAQFVSWRCNSVPCKSATDAGIGMSHNPRSLPPPLRGRAGVGGGCPLRLRRRFTPHPNPPPQGGRERPLVVARRLLERFEQQHRDRRSNRQSERSHAALPPPLRGRDGVGGGFVPQPREANSESFPSECGDAHPNPPPQGGREPSPVVARRCNCVVRRREYA
jgi:hypothetical protein